MYYPYNESALGRLQESHILRVFSYIGTVARALAELDDLHVRNIASINGKTQKGFHLVKAGSAGRPGVQMEKIMLLVKHDLENMRMPADENTRLLPADHFAGMRAVLSRVATDVRDKYFYSLAFEKLVFGIQAADLRPIDVTMNSPQRLQCLDLPAYINASNIACMPNFIRSGNIFRQLFVEMTVGIR